MYMVHISKVSFSNEPGTEHFSIDSFLTSKMPLVILTGTGDSLSSDLNRTNMQRQRMNQDGLRSLSAPPNFYSLVFKCFMNFIEASPTAVNRVKAILECYRYSRM